jgi:hypothetical protein
VIVRLYWIILYSCALAVCTASARLGAQSATGVVTGRVQDSEDNPLGGVTVDVDSLSSPLNGITDDKGGFVIERVPIGSHILLLRRLGLALYRSSSFRVTAQQSTSVMRITMTLTVPRAVWLGCGSVRVDSQLVCDAGTVVAAPTGLPPGLGVIRNAPTWNRLWAQYGDPRKSPPKVDWQHRMVVVVSSQETGVVANLGTRLNRVLEWPDSTLIELGPDAIHGGDSGDIDEAFRPVYAWVVRRSNARVIVRRILGGSRPPQIVNWEKLSTHQKTSD